MDIYVDKRCGYGGGYGGEDVNNRPSSKGAFGVTGHIEVAAPGDAEVVKALRHG